MQQNHLHLKVLLCDQCQIFTLPVFSATMNITSPTYKNVVSQFLAGHFYCKFGIYNAESMFCQNIVPLGQLEAEILIDLCSIKRSYIPDPIKRSYMYVTQ